MSLNDNKLWIFVVNFIFPILIGLTLLFATYFFQQGKIEEIKVENNKKIEELKIENNKLIAAIQQSSLELKKTQQGNIKLKKHEMTIECFKKLKELIATAKKEVDIYDQFVRSGKDTDDVILQEKGRELELIDQEIENIKIVISELTGIFIKDIKGYRRPRLTSGLKIN